MSKVVAEALKNLLYGAKIDASFGKNPDQNETRTRTVITGISSTVPELPYIIPDNIYRPKVMVAFDFTHKYTSDFTSETGVKSEKPVSDETFQRCSTQLIQYLEYFFEYTGSYSGTEGSGINSGDADYQQLLVNYFLNYYLTNVSTSSSVNQMGTCTLSFADNVNFRNNHKTGLLYQHAFSMLSQLFVPMVPVMVWGRGRLYKDWYFPIFDGYITSMEIADSGGFSSLTVSCRDTLEIARISTDMIRPSIVQPAEILKKNSYTIYSMPFYNVDHLAVFTTMFTGGHITYLPDGQRTLSKDTLDNKSNEVSLFGLGNFKIAADEPLMQKLVPSTKPADLVDDTTAIHSSQMSIGRALKETSHTLRPRYISTWGASMTPFRIFGTASPEVFNAEFSSRLEIIESVAANTYFNFYVDGYGTVHYHPMRIANQYLLYDIIGENNKYGHVAPFPGSQVIGPHETYSRSTRINVEELVTFLQVQGQNSMGIEGNFDQMTLWDYATDDYLMSRFGYRRKSVSNSLINVNPTLPGKNGKKASLLKLMAKALLHHANSELFSTQASIPFRPELRMARPIFYPYDNDIFYCTSIDHSISMNGDATTSVGGTYGRKEKEIPTDIYSFLVMTERMYKTTPDIYIPASLTTAEEVQDWYEKVYNIKNIDILQWFDEIDKAQAKFTEFEKARSGAGIYDDSNIG